MAEPIPVNPHFGNRPPDQPADGFTINPPPPPPPPHYRPAFRDDEAGRGAIHSNNVWAFIFSVAIVYLLHKLRIPGLGIAAVRSDILMLVILVCGGGICYLYFSGQVRDRRVLIAGAVLGLLGLAGLAGSNPTAGTGNQPTAATASEQSAAGDYVVQFGAFRDEASARRCANQVARTGIARVGIEYATGRNLHLVVTSDRFSLADAQRVADAARNHGLAIYVRRYNQS